MIPEKMQRRPLLDPLLLILKSRRFLTAFAALLVTLLIGLVPELEPIRADLTAVIIALALALIGGYSVEDAATAAAARNFLSSPDWRDHVREIVESVLDSKIER